MQDIKIKKLSFSELDNYIEELKVLDKLAFQDESWDDNAFKYSLPQKFEKSFFVIQDGKIIAYCINSIKEGVCYIHRLVVDQRIRKKGLGSIMINYIKSELKEDKIALKVNVNNIFAINFYFKMNFKIISIEKEYYSMIKV
jgi:ribosomal protein S18 acetylase RimI-like enzyme